MNTCKRIVSSVFAGAALVTASIPAFAYSVWPDIDFEWYANVGKPLSGPVVEVFPAPREGYIWVPGRYENHGVRQVWVRGHWIVDDYEQQRLVAIRDREGNPIPLNADAYPVDSALK